MGALPIRKISGLIPAALWFCFCTSGCFHNPPDIEAKAEHPVEVRLPANPSTGYRWMLDPPLQSGRILAESYEAGATGGPVGTPGTQILRVVFPREGRFNLKLAYRRLWEPVSVPPAQTTNLVVKVLPAKGDRTLMEKLFTKDIAPDSNIPQPESEEELPQTPGRRVELKRPR
ncbi:hypothetical protein EBT23_00530 [bacterium]|nr:hypothetical protein [bacterium]